MAIARKSSYLGLLAFAAVCLAIGGYAFWAGISTLRMSEANDVRAFALLVLLIGAIALFAGARVTILWTRLVTGAGILSLPYSSTGANYVSAVVRPSDIPAVFAALRDTGNPGSYAALIPSLSGGLREELNISFFLGEEAVGFDWLLDAPANKADRTRFEQLAARMGFALTELESYEIRYLRIVDESSLEIAVEVITTMYSIPDTAEIELVGEGFEWPGQQ